MGKINFAVLILIIVSAASVKSVIGGDVYPVRPLFIKAYPAVDNYQSDIYEVYQEPYPYVSPY